MSSYCKERCKKRGYFTVRLTVGGAAPPGLTASICENVDPFSFKVCIPPEEEAFASKACGNKINICKTVCRCPKQQKTTPKDQYTLQVNFEHLSHIFTFAFTESPNPNS